MSVAAGQMLGPYEIIARIGAGGMGEVFKARDTRLDRSVAIKVLPEAVRGDERLRARFDREARAISRLAHPHICTLYDVGPDYLVMELLEGETLADRLLRGALSPSEAIRYGIEIASALDKAHRAGVIHRDLKPANIMITKGGAKLLDFGLARTAQIDVDATGATQHKPLTEEGAIVGTFQYMAPEQLEGLDADARTDIFALGEVLYEMVTGRRAFEGATKTSLIAAIVTGEPRPMAELQPLAPRPLEHVVQTCLAKDPDHRWQSAADVAAELRWVSGSSAEITAARKPVRMRWLGWIAAALIAAVAITYALVQQRTPRPRRIATSIALPAGVEIRYRGGAVALSPDGRTLAFVARRGTEQQKVWLRPLDSERARLLPGSEGATCLLWSPDSKSLLFQKNAKLTRVEVASGASEVVMPAIFFSGGDWTDDGELIVSIGDGILYLRADGKPRVLSDAAIERVSWPRLMPDGRTVLFVSTGTAPGVYAVPLDGSAKPRRVLTDVTTNFTYLEPGWIVYSRESDLLARRFDVRSLTMKGDPVRLASGVQFDPEMSSALFTIANGMLVFLPGEVGGRSQLIMVARDGRQIETLTAPGLYFGPRLSHDGTRVAVDQSDQTSSGDIWVLDLRRKTYTRLTWDDGNESAPAWSRDDRLIYHFLERGHGTDVYAQPTGGMGSRSAVLTGFRAVSPLDVSPDGRWLAMFSGQNRFEVVLLDLQTRKTTPLLVSPFDEGGLQFSPDGKWIASVSTESGRSEVYVREFPEASGKWMVSRDGGSQPSWRADGRELYYVSRDNKIMAVPLRFEPSFEAGAPVPLFTANVRENPWYRDYAATRDGQRFIVNRAASEFGTQPLTLVQNALPR